MPRYNSRNGTYKPRGTFFLRHALQTIQQHLIFNIIGSIFSSITCRINSRLLIQIINFQSGIICQHNIITMCSNCFCLNQCIFLKCCSILDNVHINSGFFHGKDLPSKISQNLMDLSHFIFIACRKNNSLFHTACPSFLSKQLKRLYLAMPLLFPHDKNSYFSILPSVFFLAALVRYTDTDLSAAYRYKFYVFYLLSFQCYALYPHRK